MGPRLTTPGPFRLRLVTLCVELVAPFPERTINLALPHLDLMVDPTYAGFEEDLLFHEVTTGAPHVDEVSPMPLD